MVLESNLPLANRRRRIFGVLLCVGVLLIYSNSLSVPFLLDDFATIPSNRSITRLSDLSSVFFPPPEVYSAGRPILNLSYALNYAVGGTKVGGYHIFNVMIHGLAALTLFGLVRRTLELPRFAGRFGDSAALTAFAISALWAFHPLQTVSVTYLSQRAESLMGLFYLLTFYCFIRSVPANSLGWKTASVAACAFGMATKEVMATAPVVLFLLDAVVVTGSFREAWRQRARYYVALGLTWLLLFALVIGAELSKRAVGVEHGLSWYSYARIECVAVVRYLGLTLFPFPLIFDYGANLPTPPPLAVILSAAFLVGLLACSARALWRCRIVGFFGCAFFLFLAPTSSVVPIAGQPIAENRLYIPLAFVVTALIVAVGAAGLRRSYVWIVAALALGFASHARNTAYLTPGAIWRDTVAKQPMNARAWVFLSEALKAEGKIEDAVSALQRAVRHRPESAELSNNLAVTFYLAGRVQESVAQFQKVIREKPEFADAYYNFGALLYRGGNTAAALECFQIFLRLKPRSTEGHNYAGLCFLRFGKPNEAAAHFQAALEIDPSHKDARSNLESTRASLKK